jgi:hypothetical protein
MGIETGAPSFFARKSLGRDQTRSALIVVAITLPSADRVQTGFRAQ